jgi:hypothetical protein
MAVKRIILISLSFILSIGFILCRRTTERDKLVEYIIAEKQLRERLGTGAAVEDSVVSLRQRFNIDPEQPFSELTDKPESWIDILQDLKDAK